MGLKSVRASSGSEVWALARRQHGVVTRAQLVRLGFSSDAIEHRVAVARLHPVMAGVYAVGSPQLTERGRWMAAVLACGPAAVLSHGSAAALWEIGRERSKLPEVCLPSHFRRRRPGIRAHRRKASDRTSRHRIPVTTPACTLIDLASYLPPSPLEAAINEAGKRGLADPDALRAAAVAAGRRPGASTLRRILDGRTFTLTDSELERLFLPITRRADLTQPLTGCVVIGFRVDFHWPELGLVVETDGLRYHRTPTQQSRDRERDQAHTAAGLTCLRFTHAQVRYAPEQVEETLAAVARRLRAAGQLF